ncbi:MAG: LLM class F420-dependent oxidoreductase [Pseudomonadota bacterium]
MKYGLIWTNAGPFCEPERFGHLAQTAEKVGFESFWTIEHVVIPVGYKATYPYDPSGKLPMTDDFPLADPIVPLAYAAAVTSTMKLATGVVILPQRHPMYVAKEAATLDRLCNGRFMLGVGIGWLEDEFEALNIPFAERVGRTEESIDAMRSLWREKPEPFEGQFFNWGKVECQPKPKQVNGIPIVIGGHVNGAARRAARYGDGFFAGVFQPEVLAPLVEVMSAECEKVGRTAKDVEVSAVLAEPDLGVVDKFREAGADRLIIFMDATQSDSDAAVEDYLSGFAENVINKS